MVAPTQKLRSTCQTMCFSQQWKKKNGDSSDDYKNDNGDRKATMIAEKETSYEQ